MDISRRMCKKDYLYALYKGEFCGEEKHTVRTLKNILLDWWKSQ